MFGKMILETILVSVVVFGAYSAIANFDTTTFLNVNRDLPMFQAPPAPIEAPPIQLPPSELPPSELPPSGIVAPESHNLIMQNKQLDRLEDKLLGIKLKLDAIESKTRN